MIFLKRIEAFGFKSFAEPITLNFEYGMTGIVGPNGSGKSNINDAIRWAFGEQSLKSLRGDNMENVVFSGSESKKGFNVAEVTLVFDNSQSVFSSLNFEEVSIKRRYDRTNNESEYFINNTKVRQKDIQEIALETGLTKSSLAIISQGSVNSFVESKAEDRRKLFDEAAGVAKYKKRREETIRKIARSKENLDRINDIVNEIDRRLPSLKKQSKKALLYKEKENELQKYEVSFLINDIKMYEQKIANLNKEKEEFKILHDNMEVAFKKEDSEKKSIEEEILKLDRQITKQSNLHTNVVEKIAKLEVRKVSFESKKNSQELTQSEHRIETLNNLISEVKNRIENENNKLKTLEQEEIKLDIELSEKSDKRYNANYLLDSLKNKINKINLKIDNLQDKKMSDSLFEGVKNILENRNSLPGIIGVVQELISFEPKYEQALGAVLQQGSLQNIVVNNSNDVKTSINFLKKNNAGHATFIPLDIIKSNVIDNERRFIIQNANGFINFANDLIKIDKKYQIVADYLLGGIIVVDNYESALEMAKVVKYKLNIVTINGERILPQGAIIGGNRKVKLNISNFKDEIESLELEKNNLNNSINDNNKIVANLSSEINLIREKKGVNKSSLGSVKTTLSGFNSELNKYKDEYSLLTGKDFENIGQQFTVDSELEKIISELISLEKEKFELLNDLTFAQNAKDTFSKKLREISQSVSEKFMNLNNLFNSLKDLKTDILLMEERKMSSAARLAETYNLTIESALKLENISIEKSEEYGEIIKTLRQELKTIGNVNIESIKEFEEEQERYNNLLEQLNEVNTSIKNLSEAIQSMDEQMEVQFKSIIKDVNNALPLAFQTLFGGGDAKIIYSDPEDILNSGIEIKVNPPGKKITNLNLLSGGEKSLVALCVLFSILSVRPLPLVILDEVEAPLDVANVERFAKYIRTFTEKTQFMIVTHRMGTMENCDILYGATMEHKGITKIVNVNLVEAKTITNAN